jgi:hypothetical protein
MSMGRERLAYWDVRAIEMVLVLLLLIGVF